MSNRILVPLAIALLLLAGLLNALPPQANADPSAGQRAAYFVSLVEQADLGPAYTINDWDARGAFVLNALRETASRTQGPVLAALETLQQQGHVSAFYPHYVGNLIVVYADRHAAATIGDLPQVASVQFSPEDQSVASDEPAGAAQVPTTIGWNLDRIRADEVWARYNITGTGIIVADLDSGVEYTHPALVHQYLGNDNGVFDHEYRWWDPSDACDYPCNHESTVPHLSNGHGTATTGIMVGDDGGVHQIGVAPGAKWIAAFACCRETTIAEDMVSAIEWALAPWQVNDFDPAHPTADPSRRPHIVNGSFGFSPGNIMVRPLMEAYLAAGIFSSFSAGSIPGECGNLATPADLPMTVGVGAIYEDNSIYWRSAFGPIALSPWLKTHTVTGPDLVAPGINAPTSLPGGTYGTIGATSGASPHVAGAAALLWSAEPELIGRVMETGEILRRSAYPLTTTRTCGADDATSVPNNVFGWGGLDVLAAVELIWQAGTLSGQVTSTGDSTPVAEATISASRGGYTLTTQSDTSGNYALLLGQGSYTITVAAYGHDAAITTAVAISEDITTMLDAALPAQGLHVLSGTVSGGDALAESDPMNAQLGIWGTPFSTTIPLSGDAYSTTLPAGTYWLRAIADGYSHEDRTITVTGELVEDIDLTPTWTYYFRDSHSVCGPDYEWIDATGGTPHTLPYVSSFSIYKPDMPFTFYGDTHARYFVDTNGHVTFGRAYNVPHRVLPYEGPPNNAIFGFGATFNPLNGAQGIIYDETVEDRYLVVEFNQVHHWWNGYPETFEFVLDSETGSILLQYQEVRWPDYATVGVENQDGSDGVVYSYANSRVLTDSLAIGFYPIFGPPPIAQTPDGVFGAIAGTVTSSASGRPIVGAVVTATTHLRVLTTTTAAQGQYAFSDICADAYEIEATAPGYEASSGVQAVMRQAGAIATADLALTPIALTGVNVSGVISGPAGSPLQFSATVAPASAARPITYTWEADGQAPVVHTGGLVDTVAFTWQTAGTKTITVTATNDAGSVSAATTVEIIQTSFDVFLPFALRP